MLDQLALADFITRGELDRHLRRMRSHYRSRRAAGIGLEGLAGSPIAAPGPEGIVLGYGSVAEPVLRRGLTRLAEALGWP